jgi:hypothetical protein
MERPSARLRRGGALVCPLCRSELAPDALPGDACDGCGTLVHSDCAAELGGCPTQGCPARGVAPAPTPALDAKRVALVDEHTKMLERFRRLRDAHQAARRWVDLGMAMRFVGLVSFGLAIWWTSEGNIQIAVPAFVWGSAMFGLAYHIDRH